MLRFQNNFKPDVSDLIVIHKNWKQKLLVSFRAKQSELWCGRGLIHFEPLQNAERANEPFA